MLIFGYDIVSAISLLLPISIITSLTNLLIFKLHTNKVGINFDKNIKLDDISREIREKVDIQEIHDYLNKKHFNLKYGYTDPIYKNHIDIDYYTNILNMSQNLVELLR